MPRYVLLCVKSVQYFLFDHFHFDILTRGFTNNATDEWRWCGQIIGLFSTITIIYNQQKLLLL